MAKATPKAAPKAPTPHPVVDAGALIDAPAASEAPPLHPPRVAAKLTPEVGIDVRDIPDGAPFIAGALKQGYETETIDGVATRRLVFRDDAGTEHPAPK